MFNEESGPDPGISERINEGGSPSEKRSRGHNPCRWSRYQTPLPHPRDYWPRSTQPVLHDSGEGNVARADASARVALDFARADRDRIIARSRAFLLPIDFRNIFGEPGNSARQTSDRGRDTLWSLVAMQFATHQHGGNLPPFRLLLKRRRAI